jgi:S-adenosylhomocysteine hydrolase
MTGKAYDVKDLALADRGHLRTDWVLHETPVLETRKIRSTLFPAAIDQEIVRLKLEVMGVHIATLTTEQATCLASWQAGTEADSRRGAVG